MAPVFGTGTRALAALMAGIGASWPGICPASDLSWSGPADCARSEQLVFQVERALGAPLADTGKVHLQVHVARTVPTARALLRISDEASEPPLSERRLVAPDCDKLVDTLAVAIALAIEAASPPAEAMSASEPTAAEPSSPALEPLSGRAGSTRLLAEPPATLRRAAARPAPAQPVSAPSLGPAAPASEQGTPPSDPGTPPSDPAAPAPIPHGFARLLGDVGSLPEPAIGVSVGARLGWSSWSLELAGALWGERHASIDSTSTPGAGANVSLITGALGACALPLGENSAELALCASWEMGRVSGVGTGVSSPRRANGLWLAPGIEAGFTWRPTATRLGIGARLGAFAPLGQRAFFLERLGTVHEVSSLVARAGLSVDVAFQ